MHPLWIFLTGLVVGLGATFALQARWNRARQRGARVHEILLGNALGWLAAVAAGLASYPLVGTLLPQASNRNSAILSVVIGLAAFTLLVGLVTRGPDGRRIGLASAATSGLLQLAVVAGFPVALMFGIYWLFGN